MTDDALAPYMRRALSTYSQSLAQTSEALGAASLYVAIVRDQEQTEDDALARYLIHELHMSQFDLRTAINRITDITAKLDASTGTATVTRLDTRAVPQT